MVAVMVSDQEIASSVESILRQAGPGAASSLGGFIRQLEAKLGVDLTHKAGFVREQIQFLLGPPKDHFALHPQFLHIPAASAFTHFPHHHDLAFTHFPLPPHTPEVVSVPPQLLHPTPSEPAPKESAPVAVKRRGGPGGLSKVCGVSPELQAIVGEPTMARTQIVKQLWAYIRKNNLQDPNNKRKIICNDELRLVFETDCTDMFKMNKLLAKHIISLEPTKESGPKSKKLKVSAAEVASATECDDASRNPVAISDALANFLGITEREMRQSEALSRVWDYIKANQLEDPVNPMMIFCDSKLQQLFGCESLSALGISEMLARHLFRQS